MKKVIMIMLAVALFVIPMTASATVVTPKGNSVKTEVTLITQVAYDASGNVEYIGKAEPGTATDAKGWFIQKITYDASGNFLSIGNANGQSDFDKVWDDRESYNYK